MPDLRHNAVVGDSGGQRAAARTRSLATVPEGDTIHRTAAALRMALLGKPMTAFEAARLTGVLPAVGSVVERVESWGKHLEIGFDDGIVLHTHMRMSGAWHLYHPGQKWRKSARAARVVIEVPGWQAVCFSAPVVDTYRRKEPNRHPLAGSLGPDLCRADSDLAACVERIDTYIDPETSVAEMLLDQRIACGVGNVYKSEVLWAVGVHPLSPVGSVDAAARHELIDTAARLLRANLTGPERVTAGSGLAVYGRTGKPCPRCGAPIEVARHGEQARVTYWCPKCQVQLGLEPADGTSGPEVDERWEPSEENAEIYRPYEIPRPWRVPGAGGDIPRARLAVLEWGAADEGDGWYGDDDELDEYAARCEEWIEPRPAELDEDQWVPIPEFAPPVEDPE